VPRYLVMTLAAPIASFGGVAPGEQRSSWDRPSNSALLGLVAAALGLRRDDETHHAALAQSLRFAVRIERPGHLLTDYQTAQTAPTPKGRAFATRREVLGADRIETILSRREYRTDVLFTVAIATLDNSVPLDDVATALMHPRFALYLGRKSCPLALPLFPRIVEAPDIVSAFTCGDAAESPAVAGFREAARLVANPTHIAVDQDLELPKGEASIRIERRRDGVLHRGRRQFVPRADMIVSLSRSEKGAPS
jgi:CRISPR system Cascade subunit CasD